MANELNQAYRIQTPTFKNFNCGSTPEVVMPTIQPIVSAIMAVQHIFRDAVRFDNGANFESIKICRFLFPEVNFPAIKYSNMIIIVMQGKTTLFSDAIKSRALGQNERAIASMPARHTSATTT